MTKEEMIEKVLAIKDPKKERYVIYQIGRELDLKLKPTNCNRCLRDYIAIIKQELGLIEDAAEQSDFNTTETDGEWKYLKRNGTRWNGRIYDQNTDPKYIRVFVKNFPTGFYEKIEKPQPQPETVVEEENINNEANFILK